MWQVEVRNLRAGGSNLTLVRSPRFSRWNIPRSCDPLIPLHRRALNDHANQLRAHIAVHLHDDRPDRLSFFSPDPAHKRTKPHEKPPATANGTVLTPIGYANRTRRPFYLYTFMLIARAPRKMCS